MPLWATFQRRRERDLLSYLLRPPPPRPRLYEGDLRLEGERRRESLVGDLRLDGDLRLEGDRRLDGERRRDCDLLGDGERLSERPRPSSRSFSWIISFTRRSAAIRPMGLVFDPASAPKMMSRSSPRASRAMNMYTPVSCSMRRSSLPRFPVTQPLQLSGKCTSVASSRCATSGMVTLPRRCCRSQPMNSLQRLRSFSVPAMNATFPTY